MAYPYYGCYEAYPPLPFFGWDPYLHSLAFSMPPFPTEYPCCFGCHNDHIPQHNAEHEEDAEWTHIEKPSDYKGCGTDEAVDASEVDAFQDAPVASSNLYVTNLPPSYTPVKVRGLFQPFGPIFSIVVFKSRRAACVQFDRLEDATKALNTLNGLQVTPQRMINVKYANKTYTPHHRRPIPPPASDSGSESEGPFGLSPSDASSALHISDRDSVCSLDLHPEASLKLNDADEWNDLDLFDWNPPSRDAIEEANLLLEAAMIGSALNAKLREAFESQADTDEPTVSTLEEAWKSCHLEDHVL